MKSHPPAKWATSVIAVALLSGCGSTAAAGTSAGTGQVEGAVTAGPSCPVERIDHPCPPAPVAGASVELLRADAETVVTTHTDPSGRFRLTTAPGTFTVRATNVGGYRSQASRTVTVSPGHTEEVDLTLDTGIR